MTLALRRPLGRSQTRPMEAFVVTENKNRPFQKRFRAPRSAVAYRFLGWSIFIAVYLLFLWVFLDISQVFFLFF